MDRFGATFIPPFSMTTISGETGASVDINNESDTVSTSGDED